MLDSHYLVRPVVWICLNISTTETDSWPCLFLGSVLGAGSLRDLFSVKMFAGNHGTDGVERKPRRPPDRREAVPKSQSDNRWAVTLSGTSHWYSNLLHFPRERTPLRKTLLPYSSLCGFDPLNVKQISGQAQQRLIQPVCPKEERDMKISVEAEEFVDVWRFEERC